MDTLAKYARRLTAGIRTKELSKQLGFSSSHVSRFRRGQVHSLVLAELIIEEFDPTFMEKVTRYNAVKKEMEYLKKQNAQLLLMLKTQEPVATLTSAVAQ